MAIKRIENGWQIASYAAQNAPQAAIGYRLEFLDAHGHTAHLPATGAWGLNPVVLPVGVPATKLHLIYVGTSGEAIPGPANLTALELVVCEEDSAEREREEASETTQEMAEAAQVRQDLARTDMELLTIGRLQSFLGTSLKQFERLQESSIKSAEAQVEMSLKNLEKLTAQGGKMLDGQYQAAKLLQEHLTNLKPPVPPPPPTDMGTVMMGLAEVVRDCLVTFQGGAPALAALPALRSEARGRATSSGAQSTSSPEIRDAEPVALDPVKRAAAYILGVADEKQLRQLSEPKRFNEFVEGFRKLMLPQETASPTTEEKISRDERGVKTAAPSQNPAADTRMPAKASDPTANAKTEEPSPDDVLRAQASRSSGTKTKPRSRASSASAETGKRPQEPEQKRKARKRGKS